MSSARIEELRKKFDENPRRYFAPLANEYRKVGDFDQAIFICQEYLPQQPGHMSGHIVFGQALFEAKRLPEAKTVFETALSLDPENLIALRHLADISRDLGDVVAARGWYERVLQADPRNEEIAEIMAKLGSGPASTDAAAAAPTAEAPAKAPVGTPPAAAPARPTPTAAAPTVQLSAAQVQEMLRARVGSRISAAEGPTEPSEPVQPASAEPEPELITLDTVSTVEIHAAEPAPMEGLEPTSQAATLDIPTIEPLGLETNAAPGIHMEEAPAAPAPLDGLDTIPLDISVPGSSPEAATMEIPAIPSAPPAAQADAPATDDGLLDLGSFSLGGESASAPVEPSPAETPIDGGHGDGLELLDLELPGAPATPPPAPEPSVPTMIMDAVKSVVPAVREAVESTVPMVMDAMESAAPAMIDLVDSAIPSVVEAVQSAVQPVVQAAAETPTVIMQAIKAPPVQETPAEPRTSQSVPFVTETMAQLYLSQGHRSEAIDIYRKLIEARPGDAELRARLSAIEGEERAAATARPEASAPAAAAPAPRFTGKGPSVRSVLRDLFGLDGSATFGGSAASPAVPAEVGSIDMLFSTDSVADSLTPLAVAFDGGHVAGQGTIDELFARDGR